MSVPDDRMMVFFSYPAKKCGTTEDDLKIVIQFGILPSMGEILVARGK